MKISYYPLLSEFFDKKVPLYEFEEKEAKKATGKKIEDCEIVYASGKDLPKGTPIDMAKLKFEMESAKTAIVSQSPLFAPYVHEFVPIYTWLVPTMGTDGVRLFVNPEFAESLSWLQKIFVLIHEIMHCVLLHQERGAAYDHELFNEAADHEINPIIIDTIEHFTPATIKELKGLYDEKYLNMPVEQIYKEVAKNPRKQPKQPPKPGQGPPQPIQIKPGMKVRIKATGKVGVVTKVNADGTYELNPVNESYYPKFTQLLNESYKREEIIPILPPPPPSAGGGQGGPNTDDEYEIEGQQQGQGQGQGQPGKPGKGKGQAGGKEPGAQGEGGLGSGGNGEVMKEQLDKLDPGGTGGILTKKMGEKIAEASGYDATEAKAGTDNNSTWENNGRKMLKAASDFAGGKGQGSGKGSALIGVLGRMYKAQVDWKNVLKRYVADALAPEPEQRLGNKKHYQSADFPLRYADKEKYDAIEKIIVCVDVSGSMSSETLQRITDEICGIIFAKKVNEIHIITFDDGINFPVDIVRPGQKMPTIQATRGGTDFQKPLDYIKEKYKDKVNLCIMFSDGGAGPPRRPRYANKFIWIIYDNYDWVQPFGRLIKSVSKEM